MRLPDAREVRLVSFADDCIPPYSILSHRWRNDEVLYEDLQPGGRPREKAGYTKLWMACMKSIAHGYSYIWIDTCCIDKSSSAELSESVNSMFAWYEKAEVCHAYLFDVPDRNDGFSGSHAFGRSEWFKGGWTLQELIAPKRVIFYSQGWVNQGDKMELSRTLANITGIDEDVLTRKKPLSSVSIANKMFWAAERVTTRVEDMAYCLIGLFNVNMPMIYGERAKAFIRLQEEIMKESADESLFAWIDKDASPYDLHGLLAKSPANFAKSGGIVPYYESAPREPFVKTNRGVRITLSLSACSRNNWVTAAIYCACPPHGYGTTAIRLERLTKSTSNGEESPHQYARVCAHELYKYQGGGSLRTLYVRQNNISYEGHVFEHVLQLEKGPNPFDIKSGGWKTARTLPGHNSVSAAPRYYGREDKSTDWLWPNMERAFSFTAEREKELLVVVLISRGIDNTTFALLLGYTTQIGIGACVVPDCDHTMDFDFFNLLFSPRSFDIGMDTGKEIVREDEATEIRSGKQYHFTNIHLRTKGELQK